VGPALHARLESASRQLISPSARSADVFLLLYFPRIHAPIARSIGPGNGNGAPVLSKMFITPPTIRLSVEGKNRHDLIVSGGKYSFLSLYWGFSGEHMENQGKVMVNCAL
jgi:hypothetical protein